MTAIAGHRLTPAQVRTLDLVQDFMRKHSGDSAWSANTSPKGDGRAVSVYEIFSQHSNVNTAHRRTVKRLAALGVLAACEIVTVEGGFLKGTPLIRSLGAGLCTAVSQ